MTLTSAEAFSLYAKMPEDERSINGLHKALKEKGAKIGREKLTAWAKDERWDEQLAKRTLFDKADEAAVIARKLEAASAQTLDDVINRMALAADSTALTLMAVLPSVEVNNASEAATLGNVVVKLAESIANIRRVVSETAGTVKAEASDSEVKITGNLADVMAEWQTYKTRTKV